MTAEAITAAVELATIVANVAELDADVVVSAIMERLAGRPVSALSAQAALCGVIGQLAEQRVDAMLADAELLTFAAAKARSGRPVRAETIGVTSTLLLREAGMSAAKLNG